MKCAALVVTLIACEHTIATSPDAASPFDCATSPNAGANKLYLAFEGVTLTKADRSDAPTNMTTLLGGGVTSAHIPAWRAGDADRASKIAAIACAVRESVFALDLQVTTTRPASGDYEMIVFGGTPSDYGFATAEVDALGDPDCSAANHRDIAWVAESHAHEIVGLEAAHAAAAMLGVGNGLAVSREPANCMCPLRSNEAIACDDTVACSFAGMSPVPAGGDLCGGGATTIDTQLLKLVSRYGARP